MCGRFTLRTPLSVLIERFELDMSTAPDAFDWPPRFNVAPTQQVAIVRGAADAGRRQLATVRWGLIPFWAADPSIGNRLINARGDTVASKPAFREAFKRRRCLVLADGYYEWQKMGKTKQPYLFQFADRRPFALAGLWDRWRPAEADAPIESCTIITTEANDLSRPFHDRMPVILAPSDYAAWLDAEPSHTDRAAALLRPWAGDSMIAARVSTHVNNPRHDDPACAEQWA